VVLGVDLGGRRIIKKKKPVYASPFLYMCYITHPSHSSRFDQTKSSLVIPIISSACGVNLESRMLDNILYVIDESEMPP
jgi:hypothetical protein